MSDDPSNTLEATLLESFRLLTPEQKQQVLDFVDFLLWRNAKHAAIELGWAELEAGRGVDGQRIMKKLRSP